MQNKIKIFITGGTFDKDYNELTGELYFKNSRMYELLELGRCKLNVDIETLMMVDSVEMSSNERDYIISKCADEMCNQIIITHGTDTMVNTAKKIAYVIKNKTIILTGAMIPYAFGSSSDGFFNLGSALSFAQTLQNGIYIAINGQYFNYDNVRKNTAKGYFERNNS